MGYQVMGFEGSIDSWDGTVNTHLVANAIAGNNAQLEISSDEFDVTNYAASLVATAAKGGLRDWQVTFSGILDKSALHVGNAGNFAFSGGYAAHVNAWTLNIAASVHAITQLTGSTVTNKLFRPGLITATGTYNAFKDSATLLVQPAIPSTAAAAMVLTVAASQTITFDALATRVGLGMPIGDLQTVDYTFRSSIVPPAGIVFAGTDNLIPAGTLTTPEWDSTGDGIPDRSLVFKSSTGETFTGPAFWSALSITHSVSGLVGVSVTAKGAGALVIS